MDEKKALAWQALYDNMWGIFVLGIVLPTLIYTVWGLAEIMTLPNLDVNHSMEALKSVQQAAPAEVPTATSVH